MDPVSIGIVGASTLAGLGVASVATLKGWGAYLDYKRLELASQSETLDLAPAQGRIEMADLRERVRKLEAIASGIDL
nr:hypothetical protein [uncultured Sphingomonas sp.]